MTSYQTSVGNQENPFPKALCSNRSQHKAIAQASQPNNHWSASQPNSKGNITEDKRWCAEPPHQNNKLNSPHLDAASATAIYTCRFEHSSQMINHCYRKSHLLQIQSQPHIMV
ncbi:hypothetical protein PoB_006193500 [Plakobranchus ocellatus]|uniref:Uncharacterized protein n=1 Tax=Plakobranchus ocellatus TaxID=259542 RepID=A0AAV4CU58_9GAST|nr:hypothetical protein PoB_006193500 [Plakobranchus ocellatus]